MTVVDIPVGMDASLVVAFGARRIGGVILGVPTGIGVSLPMALTVPMEMGVELGTELETEVFSAKHFCIKRSANAGEQNSLIYLEEVEVLGKQSNLGALVKQAEE